MFVQTIEKMQSQKVEECSSCNIEILNNRPPLNETTARSDPEPRNTVPSPGSQSSPSTLPLSCVLLHTDYCPQSVTVLWGRPALQQTACITNKTYFQTMEMGDWSEAQVMLNETSAPSESLQESCSVIYGYISNDTL